jgi:hypothetical protein
MFWLLGKVVLVELILIVNHVLVIRESCSRRAYSHWKSSSYVRLPELNGYGSDIHLREDSAEQQHRELTTTMKMAGKRNDFDR